MGTGKTLGARRAPRYVAAALAAAGTSTALFGAVAQASPTHHNAVRTVASAPWRHGAVPMFGRALHTTISKHDLHYKGGTNVGGVNVGVTSGPPKVYLVFWGSQWGTQGKDSKGYATFTGDPKAEGPLLQAFFAGLGTGGELFSGVATQYCEGVRSGLTKCPAGAKHVGYPTGGALAGVWEDTSAAEPHAATGGQLGAEAIKGAAHFGLSTQSANRDVQIFVLSPTGTDPDHYVQNGFCAWHDYTGDSSLGHESVKYVAFTNFPYVTDQKTNCGANSVNSNGPLDGVTIVSGHEYTETITDQFPAGGWLANNGEEIGDLCAWVSKGAGRMQDITLTTGKFAVQGEWSNAAKKGVGACAIKHPIVH